MILTAERPLITMQLRCYSIIDPTTNKGLLCSFDPNNNSSFVKDMVAQHGATFCQFDFLVLLLDYAHLCFLFSYVLEIKSVAPI